MSIKRVVVGVGVGDEGVRAVRWAADLAAPIGAEVVVVHAIKPQVSGAWTTTMRGMVGPMLTDEEWRTWRESEERRIERQASPLLRAAEVPFRVIVVEGHPAAVIMGMAQAENADLLVVGRGRGGLAERVLGSVSHDLTHHARRPVVVVPPPGDPRILYLDPRAREARRQRRVPAQAGRGTSTPPVTGRASQRHLTVEGSASLSLEVPS
jgi:nucleotide-binding universal stress UspA family protein